MLKFCRYTTISVLIFLLICLQSFAQLNEPTQIKNLSFGFKDKKVEIIYDLVSKSLNEEFRVNVEIYRKSGEKLNASTLSGDIGGMKAGNHKRIIWDSRKDLGKPIDDDVYVVLSYTKSIEIKQGNHLVKSLLMPGLGDYRLGNSKLYFLYSLAAYGSAFSTVYFNNQAFNTYSNYLNTYDIDERNDLYNKFSTQKSLSYVFLASSVALWAYDIYSVHHKYVRLKSGITKDKSLYYYNLSTKIYKEISRTQRLNTKTDFDYALEKADKFYNINKLNDALPAYKEALLLEPGNQYIINRIENINQIFENIRITNEKYNTALRIGDSLFSRKDYEKAKISFQNANMLKPDEQYPIIRLNDISYYLDIIKADDLFKIGDYKDSRQYYVSASEKKPKEIYPQSRINEIDEKLKVIEYELHIENGDKAFYNKDYELAIKYYEKALLLFPKEPYPYIQKGICEDFIKKLEPIKIPISKTEPGSNVYELEIEINSAAKVYAVVDPGAHDVSVSPQTFFYLLFDARVISNNDFLPSATYQFADGSSAKSNRFIIRKLKISGLITLYDVEASVGSSISCPILLGGSAFKKLGIISIDYINDLLIIEKK